VHWLALHEDDPEFLPDRFMEHREAMIVQEYRMHERFSQPTTGLEGARGLLQREGEYHKKFGRYAERDWWGARLACGSPRLGCAERTPTAGGHSDSTEGWAGDVAIHLGSTRAWRATLPCTLPRGTRKTQERAPKADSGSTTTKTRPPACGSHHPGLTRKGPIENGATHLGVLALGNDRR
jgi:hypothetical protein